ncbi:MAG: SNF2 helicase associated domain-containing protein [Desulfitobacteriaceae bacterium]|nr:SNF2 helicase associated domain-containing protein [Desulfitobacteriaceae bacterium]
MFNITSKMILENCYPTTFEKGMAYYKNGRVRNLLFQEDNMQFSAVVHGTFAYLVRVFFDLDGKLKSYSCNCPAFENYDGFCKHVVAVLLAVGNDKKHNEANLRNAKVRKIAGEIFHYFEGDTTGPEIKKTLLLEPTLHFYTGYDRQFSTVTLNVGEKRTYVVRDMKMFLKTLVSQEELVFGKKFTYNPHIHEFNNRDRQMIDLIKEVYHLYELSSELTLGNRNDALFRGKEVFLSESLLKRWLMIMQGSLINVEIGNHQFKEVEIVEKDLPVSFRLTKRESDIALQGDLPDKIMPLTKDGEFFFCDGKICRISENQRRNFLPFYNGFLRTGGRSLIFSGEHRERLVSELVPRVKKAGNVLIDQKLEDSIDVQPLKTEIYLDMENEMLFARLNFVYGERSINPFSSPSASASQVSERILLRDSEKERKIMSYFENGQFKVNGDSMYLDREELIFDFVFYVLPQLHQEAEIYYSDKFNRMRFNDPPDFSGDVSLNQDANLLEINFNVEGIEREEIFDLYRSLKEKKRYHRLRDGSFLPLDNDKLSSMVNLLDELELKKGDLQKEHLQVPKFRAMHLDQLLQNGELKGFKKDRHFRELVTCMRNPEDEDFQIPAHLELVLRDYQKFGFKWMKTLSRFGFGGILADDMGLGKTIQAISFIHSERGKGAAPVLVVAPSSVIFNWQEEIEKFSPGLKTLVISGSKAERKARIPKAGEYDVVITSYPLIRKDITDYEGVHFSACILDEAQHIKNPHSLTAKSVKLISAKSLFALTGTPIENSLTELWSIFDFLMPGFLPSYEKFNKKFISHGGSDGQQDASGELAKKVRPFILRRLKADVLKELPPKIELKMVSELTKEQKKVYLTYLERIRGEIAGEIEEQGFDRSRIKILAGLTRLRQICCHPALFLENYNGDSGKFLQLEEILDDLKTGGHRPLLFSQFTGMLGLIKGMLDKKRLTYFYLDGSVDIRERLPMVEMFNKGERDLFLISLKAGGTGLNLTGADTVIHFDPWWNPAVEEQASDRAHRIGQRKVVQVIKFISRGTIEEKIFELQERKKELFDKVITPGESLITALDEKEIRSILEI